MLYNGKHNDDRIITNWVASTLTLTLLINMTTKQFIHI